jgi:hypothetical protein
MSDAHAKQYYFGSGTETNQGSGTIDTYEVTEMTPEAALDVPGDYHTPQVGVTAPIAQDKRRGSS